MLINNNLVVLDVPVVKQEMKYCGAACLAMIFKFHNKNISQYRIASDIYTEGKGISSNEMISYSKLNGFRVLVFNGTIKNIITVLKKRLPLISVFSTLTGRNHYVVIIGFDEIKKILFIINPASGKVEKVTFNLFRKRSSKLKYWTLLITPS